MPDAATSPSRGGERCVCGATPSSAGWSETSRTPPFGRKHAVLMTGQAKLKLTWTIFNCLIVFFGGVEKKSIFLSIHRGPLKPLSHILTLFFWEFWASQNTTRKMSVNFIADRIVVHGREILHGIVPGSAQPFNFKKEFHLSEEEVVIYMHTSYIHRM